MEALGKPVTSSRLFIAGKYWMPKKGQYPKLEAQRKGYGVIYENGEDLSVRYGEELNC